MGTNKPSITDKFQKTLQNITNGFLEYVEGDSRGIGLKSDYNSRFFDIPTPAWFPDSLLRSLKRNLYLNMINNGAYNGNALGSEKINDGKSLDFFNDTSSEGLLKNLASSAVKSIVSVASNQIMSITGKIDSIVNGVSSLLSSVDGASPESFRGEYKNNLNIPFLTAQPYVQVYGIHVTEPLRDNLIILQKCASMFSNTMQNTSTSNNDKEKKNIQEYFSKVQKALCEALKDMCTSDTQGKLTGEFDKDIQLILMDENLRLHGFAEMMLNMTVSGTYAMKCKLPYFGGESSLFHSVGDNGFSGGAATNTAIANITRALTGFNFAWSEPISWNAASVSANKFSPLTCNFTAFNDTLEHVFTNLGFIWMFTSTSKAVTDGPFIRSPYLYNIEIPGGSRYRYCTCEFDVKPVGKTRMISGSNENAYKSYVEIFKKVYGFTVNPLAILYVPDAYDISIKFTSLLPDLWNFTANYLFNSNDVPKIGDKVYTKMAQFVADFAKSYEK